MAYFHFYDTLTETIITDDSKSLLIPKGIFDEKELYSLYKIGLKFPYFGNNWDALLDCLQDLDFIEKKNSNYS